jgi:membrane associated rhomboid family serine protease
VSRGGGGGGGFGTVGGVRIGPAQTPKAIKEVLIALLAAFLVQVLLVRGGLPEIVRWGGLSGELFFGGMVWQPITSVFMHDDQNLFHLLGNMFLIWMFGSPVAEQLGRRGFLTLFLGGGAATGLLKVGLVGLAHLLDIQWSLLPWAVPSVGASGAVFILLAWYCFSWPDRQISLLFVPIVFTAGQALPLWFVVEFGFSGGGGIDHIIHLCGVAIGWLSFVLYRRRTLGRGGPGSPPPPRRPHLRLVREDDGPVYH